MTTPLEHFKKCGPFCTHVTWCRRCMDVFGFCGSKDCDGKPRWKRDEVVDENPCVELGSD